jgi:hypothetical protein
MFNYYSKKPIFNKKFYDFCLKNTMQYIQIFTKERKQQKEYILVNYDPDNSKLYYKDYSLYNRLCLYPNVPNEPKEPYNYKYITFFISASSLIIYYYLLKKK